MKKIKYTLLFMATLGSTTSFAWHFPFSTPKSKTELSPLQARADAFDRYNQSIPLPQLNWPNKKIRTSGLLYVDIQPKTMQKTLAGEENDYFALSNVALNIDADLNQWFHAHIGVAYYKTNKGQGNRNQNTGLLLDDGYLTYSDFANAPWFIQLGQFYLPFGEYNRYAIVPTLAQILTMARETGIQAGAINWKGVTGSLYVSQGPLRSNDKRIQGNLNGGAALKYHYQLNQQIHFMTGAEYIYNMLDVNALSESDPFQTTNNPNTPDFPTANSVYTSVVPGIAAQASAGYRWITLYGQYVTALKKSNDLLREYTSPNTRSGAIMGAQPSAWDAGFKVNFDTFNKASEFDFTYSRSSQTAGLFIFNSTRNHAMPQARYIWGYSITWMKYLFTRFQWAHDWLYPEGHGDTGRQGDDVTIRVGAML